MTSAEILTLHHLRKTPTRLAIIQCLIVSNSPQSESEMHEAMSGTHDRITFYRTIQTLMETGIVHRIVADNTTVRYALNHCSIQHHEHSSDHVHFHCRECSKVECLKDIPVQQYELPQGYVREECQVIIKGICKQCASK